MYLARSAHQRWTVHPRACGEHGCRSNGEQFGHGSSPRVRGTSGRLRVRASARRFIPARAGNIPRASPCRTSRTVHPRACGEHDRFALEFSTQVGSSPRVRGTFCGKPTDVLGSGFIPARAGNMTEHTGRTHVAIGSSPRVRGTCASKSGARAGCRFIPARAGNMIQRRTACRSLPVHPRACGEHADTIASMRSSGGSSPRVRGTLESRVLIS